MIEDRANSAVRRRRRVCATYALQQDLQSPRRAREERRTKTKDGSTHSYLAMDRGEDSRGLELAIVELVVGSPEPFRLLPIAALTAAFDPVRPQELSGALRRLEQHGLLTRRGESFQLSRSVRRLIDLGLIPPG
jgi:hypothetical protein